MTEKGKVQGRFQTMENSLTPPFLTLRTMVQRILLSWRIFELPSIHQHTAFLTIVIALNCRQIVIITWL